jgi:hypothetical protein
MAPITSRPELEVSASPDFASGDGYCSLFFISIISWSVVRTAA